MSQKIIILYYWWDDIFDDVAAVAALWHFIDGDYFMYIPAFADFL